MVVGLESNLKCAWLNTFRLLKSFFFIPGCLWLIIIQADYLIYKVPSSHDSDRKVFLYGCLPRWYTVSILLVNSFVGFIGAIRTNKLLLATFAIVSVVMSSSLLFSIKAVQDPSDTLQTETRGYLTLLEDMMEHYNWHDDKPRPNSATNGWNEVQSGICCGLDGPNDWDHLRPHNTSRKVYPRSCCPSFTQINPAPTCYKESVFTMGCKTLLLTAIARMVSQLTFWMAIQLFLAFIAIILIVLIRNIERKTLNILMNLTIQRSQIAPQHS